MSVRIRRHDDVVEIMVSDNGRGISPEFLPLVFEPFRQADDSKLGQQAGFGLGLSIVKHLVEAHGGHIHASSDGEDRGTTFTVRLPVGANLASGQIASRIGGQHKAEAAG